MKIVKQDKKEGIVTLVPETLDDLWYLSHIVEVKDSISSKTTRRIQDNTGDKLRSDRGVKKTFTLRIDVENISFHIFTVIFFRYYFYPLFQFLLRFILILYLTSLSFSIS